MRLTIGLSLSLSLLAGPLCAGPLKMPEPPVIEFEDATPIPMRAVLRVPAELRDTVHVVKTSPFDKLVFPTGEWSVALFAKNLQGLFQSVMVVNDEAVAPEVDLTLRLSIVSFDAKVPNPAYNPYTAQVVYRIEVFDASGEKLFTQTATGEGQTSKGMMSGFKAKGLAAEAAKLAMVDAARQVLEGLLEADELRPAGTPDPV